MASSFSHTVRLPRRTRAASYAGQFVTRYFALGNLSRRSALALNGIGASNTKTEAFPYKPPPDLSLCTLINSHGLLRCPGTSTGSTSMHQRATSPVRDFID